MVNYKDFLILEKLNELIDEAVLSYSSDFKDRVEFLRRIGDPVARFISSVGNSYIDDKKANYNYIKSSGKEDLVSFISQARFDRMDREALSENPGSYPRYGNGLFYIDPFNTKGRTEVKIGRLIKQIAELFGTEFTDQQIEKFVNLYKSENEDDNQFKLVSGDDIKFWYNEENYYTGYGSGSLSKSCMRRKSGDFFDIYAQNPCCKMLILTKKDEQGVEKLIGRAIVWELSHKSHFSKKEEVIDRNTSISKYIECSPAQNIFMDRVYYLRQSDENRFKKYANDNDWLSKINNTSQYEDSYTFECKDSKYKGKISINVSGDCEYYPFMDTLSFINESKDELSNIGFEDGFILISEDGELEQCDDCHGSGYKTCSTCGDSYEHICGECHGSCEVSCSKCEGEGEVDCGYCDGNGKVKCSNDCEKGRFDRESTIECDVCGGDGKIEDVDCDKCGGDGRLVCPECDGEGESDCDECYGGRVECPECNGTKCEECEECNGRGNVDCEDCDGGDSKKLCDECTGLINKL